MCQGEGGLNIQGNLPPNSPKYFSEMTIFSMHFEQLKKWCIGLFIDWIIEKGDNKDENLDDNLLIKYYYKY